MKLRVLLMFLIVLTLGSGMAMAQEVDPGIPDTVYLRATVTPDFTTGQAAMEIEYWAFNDEVIVGLSSGFYWDNPKAQMDSAHGDGPLAASGNIGPFFYEDSDLDLTNTNKRFILGWAQLFGPTVDPVTEAQHLATYYFTVSDWQACDTILFDDSAFSPGSAMIFSPQGANGFTPVWGGAIVVVDTACHVAENTPPVLATIGDQTTDENVQLTFPVSATDADGDAIVLAIDTTGSGLPAAATFTDNGDGTGTFDWTPTYDDAGVYTVTFTATDGTDTVGETITITVNNVNRAPELAAIGNQTTDENVQLIFPVSATDADGDAIVLAMDTTGSGLPAAATFTDNGDGTGTFDWMPTYDDAGVYTVTFTATDGADTVGETIDITVNNVNRAPVLAAIGDKSTAENVQLIFPVSATDADGDAIVLAMDTTGSGLPAAATFTDNGDGTGTFDWTPVDGDAGTYTVTFSATDAVDTVSETITITVTPRERMLAITPDTLFFTMTTGDPAPDAQGFAITEMGGDNIAFTASKSDAWMTLDKTEGTTPDSIFVTVHEDTLPVGTYFGTLTVESAEASNAPVFGYVKFTLNPLENNAPVLDSIGPKMVNEGENLLFTIHASDPDGTMPVLSAIDLPMGATFEDSLNGTGVFDWTPTFDQAGVYNVTFIATDGALSDTEIVAITVVNVNQAPEFVDLTDSARIDECDSLIMIFFAMDPDEDDVSLSLAPLAANMVFIDSGNGFGIFTFNPDTTQAGTYVMTLTATDVTDTTTATITVVVDECNVQPECVDMMLSDTLFVFYDTIYTGGIGPEKTIEDPDAELTITSSGNEFCYDIICDTMMPPTWFTIDPMSGCTPSTVGIYINRGIMGAGDYSATCGVLGDSTVCDPNPQYFTIELHVIEIDTSEVMGDTLKVATVPTVPGAKVVVPVTFTNACDLWAIETALQWDTDFLMLDSVSFVGSRVEDFFMKSDTIDNVMHWVHIAASDDTLLVPPGTGLFADLYFSVSPETPHGFYEITLKGMYETAACAENLLFTEDCGSGTISFVPEFIAGGVVVDTSANYVCGYVVDTAGNPIPGATVELWGDFPSGTPEMTVIADSSGAFSFSEFTTIPFDLWAYMEGYYPGLVEDLNFGQSGVMIVLTPVDEPYPTPYWNDFYCDMNLYFEEPVPVGSVIDAYDPDGVHVGTFYVTEAGRYGMMPVYGEEPFNPGDQGAEDGDVITFYINGTIAEATGNVIWTFEYKSSEVCLEAGLKTKRCPIVTGWNLVSWNVDTESDAIEDALASIAGCIDVVLGFEQGGLTYDPALIDFSTLHTVDHLSGYWIKSNCDTVLEIVGAPVPVSTPIAVTAGWNLVSYLPEYNMPTEEALSSVYGDLIVALGFDDGALTHVPGDTLHNTLNEMGSCFGYWLKVEHDGELVYPESGPITAPRVRQPLGVVAKAVTAMPDVTPSTRWMDLYSRELTLDGKIVEAGATIEAFTEDGRKVGSFTMKESGKFGFMPVYADDHRTTEIEGVRGNERFYLAVNGVKTAETFTFEGTGVREEITALSTAKADGSLPMEFSLSQNYPNPFNPTTTISFSLPTTTQARIEIFNILGELVATPFDGVASAGENSVVWDGTNSAGQTVSSGIYFYRLTADTYTETKKMTLLK